MKNPYRSYFKNYYSNDSDLGFGGIEESKYNYQENKRKNYFSNYSSRYSDYFTKPRKETLEEQVTGLENELDNAGVDTPDEKNRSMLNRIIDTLSIGSYPVINTLYNLTDNDESTTALQGIAEGLKAANPIGEGNEEGRKTFSDVLTNLGWQSEDNPEGKWYNPLTWSPNNVAKGAVGFVGDVLTDPLTYTTGIGGIIRRIITGGAKSAVETAGKTAFKGAMKELTDTGMDNIIRDAEKLGVKPYENMGQDILDKISRTAGYDKKPYEGFSLSVPFTNIKKEIISADTLKPFEKLGDATVGKYFNKAMESLGGNKIVDGVSDIFKSKEFKLSRQMARENPELFAKRLVFGMYMNDINRTFAQTQSMFTKYADSLFKDVSDEAMDTIRKVMETPDAFKLTSVTKPIMNEDGTIKTTMEETAEYVSHREDLIQARDEIQSVIDKYKQIGQYDERLRDYEKIAQNLDKISQVSSEKLDDLVKSIDNPDLNLLHNEEYGKVFNEFLNKDVDAIQEDLLNKYGIDNNKSEDLAYIIRHTIDHSTKKLKPLERKMLEGFVKEKQVIDMGNSLLHTTDDDLRYFMGEQPNLKDYGYEDVNTNALYDKVQKRVANQKKFEEESLDNYKINQSARQEKEIRKQAIDKLVQREIDAIAIPKDDPMYFNAKAQVAQNIYNKVLKMNVDEINKYADELANGVDKDIGIRNTFADEIETETRFAPNNKYEEDINNFVHNRAQYGAEKNLTEKTRYINQLAKQIYNIKPTEDLTDILNTLKNSDADTLVKLGEKYKVKYIPNWLHNEAYIASQKKSGLNTYIDSDTFKYKNQGQVTPEGEYLKSYNPNIKYDDMFGEAVEQRKYDYFGAKTYEPIGQDLATDANVIMQSLANMATKFPKLKNLLGNLNIRLSDLEHRSPAGTVRKDIIMTGKKGVDTNDYINKIMPHEVAHQIGKLLYDDLFKSQEWKEVMKQEGSVFKGLKGEFANARTAQEDFAESFVKYINDKVNLEYTSPKRYEAINRIVNSFYDAKLPKADRTFSSRYFNAPEKATDAVTRNVEDIKASKESLINDIDNANVSQEEAIKQFDEINGTLMDDADLLKSFNVAYPDKLSHETVQQTQTFNKVEANKDVIKSLYKDMDDKHIKLMETIKNDFYKMGKKENIEDIDKTILTYLTHMKPIGETIEQDVIRKSTNPFANQRQIKGTIDEINKRAKANGFEGENFFETNVATIFLNRGLKNNQLVFNSQFYNNLVENFGKVYNKVDEVPLGKELFVNYIDVQNALKNIPDTTMKDELVKQLNLPKDIDNSFRPVVKIDANAFTELKKLDPNMTTFTMPELIVEDINKVGKLNYEENIGSMLKLYDKVLGLWKINATAVNPGFHIRNTISNMFQNYLNVGMTAFKPENQYMATKLLGNDEKYLVNTMVKTKDGRSIPLIEIQRQMQLLGVNKTNQFTDVFDNMLSKNVDEEGNITKKLMEGGKKKFNPQSLNPLSQDFGLYKAGRIAGGAVESQARAVNFLSNIIEGNNYMKAADNTNKFLFDYSDLSKTEKNLFRRVVPFYTWMRKNIPLQIENVLKQPDIYKKYGFVKNEIENNVPDDEKVSGRYKMDYVKDMIQMPFVMEGVDKEGHATRQPTFYNPSLPLGDLSKIPTGARDILKQLISSSNPMIKMPIEFVSNKNMYFDSPISLGPTAKADAPGYIQALLGGTQDDPIKMTPEQKYIMSSLSPALESVGKMIDPTKSDDKTNMAITKALLGQGLTPYDAEQYKKYVLKNRLKILKALKQDSAE